MVIQWLLAFLLCAPGVVQAHCRLVFDDGLLIESVLLAHTPQQQAVGLSGREAINQGMLFVWSDSDIRRFWMQNTHQPLTLYFFDASATVTQTLSMPANSDTIYASNIASRYALELPESIAPSGALALGHRLVSVVCTDLGYINFVK